jgi:hypothetical protein
MLDVAICQKKLRDFFEVVCAGQSPLYEAVCRQMLDDADLLEIMRQTPAAQPGPNLFLAAVHFLLLQGVKHELRQFYGTCVANPRPAADAWPAFRSFCLTHREQIIPLLHQGRVQTNEVRRCSYLFPAFSLVQRTEPDRPLAIIEIGTSAGLNLNWDRYAYDYGAQGRFGSDSSSVVIHSDWRGRGWQSSTAVPQVIHRVGIDLHPVDVNDRHQALWLQSLLWPDQPERFALQRAAIEEFRRSPATLVAGNALQVLPLEIAQAPADANLCIVHCHTLNQFSEPERTALEQIIRAASHDRAINVISAEWIKTPQTKLRLAEWQKGEHSNTLLAEVDHHGRWIDWRV